MPLGNIADLLRQGGYQDGAGPDPSAQGGPSADDADDATCPTCGASSKKIEAAAQGGGDDGSSSGGGGY